jgi:predicted dehydrogenase
VSDATAPGGDPLRFGILGAATIATYAMGQSAATSGDRLVAIAARDRARAEAFAAAHGVERVHDDYAAVLADPEVEVVYVPLPNGLHGAWTRAAVAAGKHVLVEKPFAANAEEAREIAAVAREAGVVVVEAVHNMHHPVLRRLFEIVGSGELGRLTRIETTVRMLPPPADDLRWSFDLAGGVLMDLGCYALHLQRRLGDFAGGEPEVVTATGTERSPGVDSSITADLVFPSGATGHVHCDMDADVVWSSTARVVGERGEVTVCDPVLPQFDDRIVVTGPDGERTERLGTSASYFHQLEALRAHLRSGTEFPFGLDDTVANAELIDAVYQAAGFPLRQSTTLRSSS